MYFSEYLSKPKQNLEDIMFDVEMVEASEFLKPGFHVTSQMEYSIVKKDTGQILNICSEQYNIVSNKQFIQPVYENLCQYYGKENIITRFKNIENKRFFVDLIIMEEAHAVTDKDTVLRTVTMRNSYDGGLKQGYGVGYYRKVCTNGLYAFESQPMGVQNRRHRFNASISIKEILAQVEKYDEDLQKFKTLQDRRLTPFEVEELRSFVKQKTEFPKRKLDDVSQLIFKEAQQLGSQRTAWLEYNGYNFVLNHADTKLSPEVRHKTDKKILQKVEELVA